MGSEKGTDYADGSQTATVGNVTFKVTYTKDAKLPKDAKLVVSKVKDTDDYVEAAKDKLGTDEFNGRFYDIHFEVDGKEYPVSADTDVKITLSGNDALVADADVKVLHFEDDSMKPEVIGDVEVSGGKQEEKADKPSVVTFTTDGFSVYAITETTDTSKTKEYRRTYTFQNDDGSAYNFSLDKNPAASGNETPVSTTTNQQIVRNGGQLLDVGIPKAIVEADKGKTFLGWGIVTGEGESATVDKTNLISTFPYTVNMGSNVNADDSVTLRAVFGDQVNIIFHDVNGAVIQTIQANKNSNVDISSVTTEKAGDDTADAYALVGWATTANAETATYTTTITTGESNVNLYPVFAPAHTITFNSNDGGDGSATVIVAQRYTANQATVAPTTTPQRQGYTFNQWYTNEACTIAFEWGNTLNNNITLYAGWTPAQTTYTVVIWRQQIGDDKEATAAQKTYDYAESHTVNAQTGTQINGSTAALSNYEGYTTGDYKGFHYASAGVSRTDSIANVTVKGDGSSVINVYYDRDLVTMNFLGSTYTSTSNPPTDGSVPVYRRTDNDWDEYSYDQLYYVQLRSGGYGWCYISGNNYYRYNGNTYYTRNVSSTFTGLYGQALSKYNYSWPGTSGPWAYTSSAGLQTGMTYLGQFVLPDDNGSSTNISFYATGDADKTYRFYLQNTDGTWPTTPDATGSGDDNWTTFNFSEKYDNFNVSQYRKYSQGGYYSYGSWTDWTSTSNGQTTDMSGYTILEVRYSRKSYNVEFYNGATHLGADQSKLYQASLSGLTTPDKDTLTYPGNSSLAGHYEFVGWFADPEGTTYVSFGNDLTDAQKKELQDKYPSITGFTTYSTMPGHNLPVYAGWKPIRLTVTLDVNGGKLPEDLGVTLDSNKSFTVDYGDFVPSSIQNSTRDGYELLGWYVTDSNGNLGEPWVFGSPVTQNITLTARWRSTGQYRVRYVNDSATKENINELYTDTEVYYRDNASVTTIEWPEGKTAPAGYQFAGWDYGGHVYKSGQTFTVDISGSDAKYSGTENDVNYVYVYAVYTKIDTTYIQYDANGGSGTLTDIRLAEGVTDNIQRNIPLNQTTTLSSGTGFTRTGYKLIGWNSDQTAANDGTVEWKLGETVGVDGTSNTLYAVWEKATDVIVKKTDNKSPATNLGGVTFTLAKQKGSGESVTWEAVNISDVTSNNGSFTISNEQKDNGVTLSGLENGTYKLTETKAPDGYIITNSETTFTVTSDGVSVGETALTAGTGGTYTITITNNPGEALPNTGGSGTTMYTLGGLTLIIASALMYGFVLRRNKRERRFK